MVSLLRKRAIALDDVHAPAPGIDCRLLVTCCIVIMAALLVVGSVSHGVLRHIVQTSPLWITIVLGLRRSRWSKWSALPCFVFWLLVMIAIWLFLLGWTRIVNGTFSLTEIAMTVVVGLSAITGIFGALRMKTHVRVLPAIAILVVLAFMQLEAFHISLLPPIAHR